MAKKKSNQRPGRSGPPKTARTEPKAAATVEDTDADTATADATDETEAADTANAPAEKTDTKPVGAKPKTPRAGAAGSRPGSKAAANRPGGRNPKKGRKPVAAPKKSLPWGMILTVSALVLVVGALIAIPVLTLPEQSVTDPDVTIEGSVDYFEEGADWVTQRDHVEGSVQYALTPPAGGNHNVAWQLCTGVVYDEQIPNEHAVHSLEHGAIWITYQPDLPAEQVERLAGKTTGQDYTFMSPYPDQPAPVILTAWGYQLQLESANDERIDQFIAKYRLTASQEPNATCSRGVTATGTTPVLAPGM
ncbi:uncharacterized protein DUF3105 [Stackebrandtia albiflava]|uniref:Uncharacterized protein DUF3105 n=1 Tax=Stackebrandtia albiflava TaxID=406432 RepID=A0A562V1T0_9ACTN|nr:DUF3105 domain-containing protein [Stackebrandtia albiflava]TWJ11880.1 uncharacterized protein DUF3105 [Stackebrandtia albiflava]